MSVPEQIKTHYTCPSCGAVNTLVVEGDDPVIKRDEDGPVCDDVVEDFCEFCFRKHLVKPLAGLAIGEAEAASEARWFTLKEWADNFVNNKGERAIVERSDETLRVARLVQIEAELHNA